VPVGLVWYVRATMLFKAGIRIRRPSSCRMRSGGGSTYLCAIKLPASLPFCVWCNPWDHVSSSSIDDPIFPRRAYSRKVFAANRGGMFVPTGHPLFYSMQRTRAACCAHGPCVGKLLSERLIARNGHPPSLFPPPQQKRVTMHQV
jgi:hypothetical protein